MTRANPWALTEAQAAAREDAIYQQFLSSVTFAEHRFPDKKRADRWLDRQFGHRAVRAAIMAAMLRRSAAR